MTLPYKKSQKHRPGDGYQTGNKDKKIYKKIQSQAINSPALSKPHFLLSRSEFS